MTTFDYKTAIEHLENGKRVRREGMPDGVFYTMNSDGHVWITILSRGKEYCASPPVQMKEDDKNASDWHLYQES